MGCVVCGLGVRGLWVSVFDVLWVVFGVVVLGGGFWPQVSIVCVCVCARARVAWWIWYFYGHYNSIQFHNKSQEDSSTLLIMGNRYKYWPSATENIYIVQNLVKDHTEYNEPTHKNSTIRHQPDYTTDTTRGGLHAHTTETRTPENKRITTSNVSTNHPLPYKQRHAPCWITLPTFFHIC